MPRHGDDGRAPGLAQALNNALAGQTSEHVRIVDPHEGARPVGLPVVVCNEMRWSTGGGVSFFYYLCGYGKRAS